MDNNEVKPFLEINGIDALEHAKKYIEAQEDIILQKSLQSSDVSELIKAKEFLKKKQNSSTVETKSILVDPNDISSAFGYKNKPFQISYDLLRAMSRVHIIKAIHETRKEQVAEFTRPQSDKASPGFMIQKKRGLFDTTIKKPTRQEKVRIEELTNFILNCGDAASAWHGDTFDVFIRKLVDDSLTLDQACFEIKRTKSGEICEFLAVDGATFRLADTYAYDSYQNTKELKNGHLPAYVQVFDGKVLKHFYPWELCFGLRNPKTDIRKNGYGHSELEDLIQTVTSILNADSYNANYFKVGSNPGGIFRYSGNLNPQALEDFKKQWTAQNQGVMNMHKIPMINADKIDFIQTHQSNRDMEYSKFQEFLIRIACAVYKIDPAEIGFNLNGSTGGQSLFNANDPSSKLEYSKDKGLKPLLKQIAFWINNHILKWKDPNYEFVFVGIEEDQELKELEANIKRLSNFETLNEIRSKHNLPPLPDGDIPLNSVYTSYLGMQQQAAMQQQMADQQADMAGEEGSQEDQYSGEDENPFTA